uniref:Uncharacterized protein n=1 Tax=Petromyzon marinus TaxID=7757 RepID=S4RPC8_PETMA
AEKDAQLQHAQKRTGELERQLKEVASKYEASAASVSRLQSEVKAMNRAVNQELVEELKRTYGTKKGAEGLVDKIKVSYEQQIRDLESQLLAARASCRTAEERATELQNLLEDSQRALPETVPLRQYEELETSFNLSLEETSERLAGLTEQYNAAQDEIGGLRHELAGLRSCSVNRQEHEAAKAATRATLDDLDRQLAEISSRHSVAEKIENLQKKLAEATEKRSVSETKLTEEETMMLSRQISEMSRRVVELEDEKKETTIGDLRSKQEQFEEYNKEMEMMQAQEHSDKALAEALGEKNRVLKEHGQLERAGKELQNQLTKLTEEVKVSEGRMKEMQRQVAELQNENSALEVSVGEVNEKKHAALTEQHVGTKEQLEKVTRKLERGSTNVEKGIVEKDNEIQRLRGEVEKLKATMEKETVSVEAFKEMRFQKEAEIMALCEQLEALNKKHKEIQSLEKMEQRMASDERHLELEAEVLSLTQQLEELRNKYEESQLEFSRYRSEADGAQDEREVADSKAGDLQKHLSNLKQKLDEASRVIKELQQRLDKSAA